ncbi:MAG: NUDIX domain-containing protein [Candidatus Saccharibacteria bacterium]|nr:NUDIX domain-containing protein [Candidatus Saccharibacteria bacterium]
MHRDELWQNYAKNGQPIADGGYPASLDNPPFGTDKIVGVCCVLLYRQTEQGLEVLFQKRSRFVDRNPETWDISAGGHVNYGEDERSAAIREAYEEIGAVVDADKLELVASDMAASRTNRLRFIYCYDWGEQPDSFHFDDQEVSEVRWVPFTKFDEFIDENAKLPLKEDHLIREIIKRFLKSHENRTTK